MYEFTVKNTNIIKKDKTRPLSKYFFIMGPIFYQQLPQQVFLPAIWQLKQK